jgi:uncharacterized protein YlzI (FlbEa/FlbD family)
MQSFLRIARTNGETFYFNMQHVSMIYVNPSDKYVVVTGTGFEKKFTPDEATELMAVVNSLVATVAQISAGE